MLYPAELVSARQKWRDDHYQALWLSIIAEKCTEMHMCDGWEFSNGGAEEFTHATQLRLGRPVHENLLFYNTKGKEAAESERMRTIALYDHHGNTLSLDDGAEAIQQAIRWISENGFEAPRLERCVELLEWTRSKIDAGFYQW